MTVRLNGCSYKDSIYATINQTPALPNISYNSPLCVGEMLNLSTNAVGGATYYWKGVNNFTSNQQNSNRSNMQFGDTGSYSLAVVVSGIAQPNTSTIFSTATLNNGDIVRCDMVESTKCSSPVTDQSNDITMTVNPWLAPQVSISANPGPSIHPFEDITFTATTTDAGSNPSYQWRRNGVNEAGATGPTWGANAQALSNGDDICVLVRSSYACPQPDTVLSNCIKLEVRLGIVGEATNNGGIKIYPNPVKGNVTITSTERIEKVEILNLLGQKLLTLYNNSTTMQIEMSGFVGGVYIIKVNDSYISRLVKE